MDRFDAMSVIVAVAEAGSLSAAARRLRMPLTSVSRRVADLEAHLGARLFTRTNRALILTDAGQGYVADCRRILDLVDEAERAAAGEFAAPKGTLTVTAPVAFGRMHLMPVVTEFLATHPTIDLRLALSDSIVNILDEHIDAALRIGRLPDSAMKAIRIGSVGRILCASPAYIARRGEPRLPEDLAGHDVIALDPFAPEAEWVFGQGAQERKVRLRPRLAVSSNEARIDAAAEGMGIVQVLSYQAAEAVAAGRLRLILRGHEPEGWPVHLVHAGGARAPQKQRAFLDFAAPRLRRRLAAADPRGLAGG